MSGGFETIRIELSSSEIDGIGVFAVKHFRTGEFIAFGISELDYARLVLWSGLNYSDGELVKKITTFCIGTPDGFIPPDKLDFNKLSIEWYLNHSCEGNVGFNEEGDFVARRAIEKGEELTYDYALAESNPRFRMECRCGSVNCRRIVTGNDWKDAAFRAKNLSYMLPRLRRDPDAPQRATHPRRAANRR